MVAGIVDPPQVPVRVWGLGLGGKLSPVCVAEADKEGGRPVDGAPLHPAAERRPLEAALGDAGQLDGPADEGL